MVETIKPTMRPTNGQLSIPLGGVLLWFPHIVPMLPTRFAPCNGQTINDVRSPLNGRTLPNLNNGKYLVGGANADSGAVIGSNGVTLTAANLPAVTLTGNTGSASAGTPSGSVNVGSGGTHSHTVNDPGHFHDIDGISSGLIVGLTMIDASGSGPKKGKTASKTTGVTVNSGGDHTHSGTFTGSAMGSHSHSMNVTLGSENPTPVEFRPPSVSGVWIMRIR